MDPISAFFWNVINIMLWSVGIVVGAMVLFVVVSIVNGKEAAIIEARRKKDAELDRQKHLASGRKVVEGIVDGHLDTLARQRMAMVRVDRYGVVEAAKWNAEVQHFVDKVIVPKLSVDQRSAMQVEGINSIFQVMIEDRVAERQEELQGTISSIDGLSPFEFENWCKLELERNGWSAQLTKAGADQGADVIASRDGVTVILQCKLYNRPVGNGAVQEIFAAKSHYGAHAAAVVTNAAYTASAKALAGTTGVILLGHTDIGLLDELLI